jgi:hypothetical protein
VGAQALRRILVAHARAQGALDGGASLPALDQPFRLSAVEPRQIAALDQALTRLAQEHPRAARVVEVRFFGGVSMDEGAMVCGCDPLAATREWRLAREWLTGGSAVPEPLFRKGWSGPDYEMEIALGASAEVRLAAALEALWAHPSLRGCYRHCDREPHEQERIGAAGRVEEKLYGAATAPNGIEVACRSLVRRVWDDEDRLAQLTLCFGLNLSSLGDAYPIGGYPFGELDAARYWKPIIDGWLVDIVRAVDSHVPCQLAAVGFDVTLPDLDEIGNNGVPAKRMDGLLTKEGGSLVWHPPTQP